jgi:CMP-N-acetylneuraminic acid synthetase
MKPQREIFHMSFSAGTLAVIPARSGSKRLPGKNLRILGGKSLITWTIEASLKAKGVGTTLVSTDSEEIAEVSRSLGAWVPFLRPPELATDSATSFEVVKHAIESALAIRPFDRVVLLQPTSPLRGAEDIDACLEKMEKKSADSVVSVCEADHSPLWMNVLPADYSLDGFINSETMNKRSQDLPVYYRLNGAVYAIRIETLLREKTFLPARNAFAHIMSKERSVDIDDALDFALAQCCLDSLLSK